METKSGSGFNSTFKQCAHKANCDPNANGKPTTCGVHSETRKAARRAKQDAKWEANRIRDRLNADIGAVHRTIELIDRRCLSVPDVCRAALNAILTELGDA